jgi:hypothetical protein
LYFPLFFLGMVGSFWLRLGCWTFLYLLWTSSPWEYHSSIWGNKTKVIPYVLNPYITKTFWKTVLGRNSKIWMVIGNIFISSSS